MQIKYEKKKANERAFRKQTAQEIKSKEHRHKEAKRRVVKHDDHAYVMAQHKLIRQDKGRDNPDRLPPEELALPQDMALPAGLFLSPKSAGSPATLYPMSPSSEKSQGLVSGDQPSIESLERQLTSTLEIKTSPPKATPSSTLGASGGMASSAAGGSSHRSSNSAGLSGSDSEGADEFLADLQNRSGTWLKDLRVKADNTFVR